MKGVEFHLETIFVYVGIFFLYHTKRRSGLYFAIIFFLMVIVTWT